MTECINNVYLQLHSLIISNSEQPCMTQADMYGTLKVEHFIIIILGEL